MPHKGQKHTLEAIVKMRDTWTSERRAKQSVTMLKLGDNHPMKRPEVAAKAAAARKNKGCGNRNPMKRPEVVARVAAANRGQKHPSVVGKNNPMKRPEQRARQSVAWRGEGNPMKRPEVAAKTAATQRGRKRPSITGDKHPQWRGGISREPYAWAFNEELKEEVRRRDGHYCQRCGKTQIENGQRLSVHHIDYDKKNSDLINFISLCRGCNARVDTNREYWAKYFSGLNRELVT